jgi:O-antigen/teichoic acid export membrane protein
LADPSSPVAHPKSDGLRVGFVINLAGRASVMLSGAAISLLLARHYGAETFGRWSVATAFATLVGTVLDGGFHRLLMRDLGRSPAAARAVLLSTVTRRLQIAGVSVPLALLIAAASVGSVRTWVLVALLVLARVVWDIVGTFSSVLLAFDRFRLPNLVETGRRTLLLAAVVVLVVTDAAIEWAAIATLLLCALGSGAIIRPTLRLVSDKLAPRPDSRWSDAAWFWLNGVLFWVNAEVDQLMLGSLGDNYQAGIYAAAVRLVMVCMVIPRAVNDTVVRRWFRAGKEPDDQMVVTTLLLVLAGALIGGQFVLFPREIIDLVFSTRYAESIPCFAVLGWFLIFHFARCAPSWFIATSDRVPLSTAFFATAAVGNFLANLWLIPRYGALGASYATAASELLLLLLAYGAVGRTAPKLVLAAGLGSVPAVCAGGLALALRPHVPWYVAAAASLLSTAVLVVLFTRAPVVRRWVARHRAASS